MISRHPRLKLARSSRSPGGKAARAGIASLITVAGRHYLVDAGVGMLVLSHIGTVGPDDVEEIRRHYAGRIAVGEDLARY